MGYGAGDSNAQSLADFIAALRPGDACPFCGSQLETVSSAAASARDLDSGESGSLGCGLCGCQVWSPKRTGTEGNRGVLSTAA